MTEVVDKSDAIPCPVCRAPIFPHEREYLFFTCDHGRELIEILRERGVEIDEPIFLSELELGEA